MKRWLKFGLIGIAVSAVIFLLTLLMPIIGFIVAIPSVAIYCNLFSDCVGEYAGLLPSFAISLISIVIIFVLIGFLLDKYKK